MKKLLILLFLSVLNSASVNSKFLASQMLEKNSSKRPEQMSKLEKFVRNFGDRGQQDRVNRWFKVESIDDQEKIIKEEKYNWHHNLYSGFPRLWPTMIHCFSKEIDKDKNLLNYAVFREVAKNQNNKNFDNSVYATVMASMFYRNPVSHQILAIPGILEFGYNISDGQLYHRCFKGIGWDGFEDSFAPVKVYANTKSGAFSWDVNNLESFDFKSEKFPDLITRVYKPNNVTPK
jgi:hypothetical protein